MSKKIKIVVFSGQPLLLEGIGSTIAKIGNMQLVAAVTKETQLRTVLDSKKVDLALIDVDSNENRSLEVLKSILDLNAALKVIMIGSFADKSLINSFFKNGANNFFNKDLSAEDFTKRIQNSFDGNATYSSIVMEALLWRPNEENRLLIFNPKELEILKYICAGLLDKQIAAKLNIVIGTVDYHKKKISAKTGCNSKAALIMFAIKNNLVSEVETNRFR